MRVGLLGGSFNPIHRCHLSVAEHAQRALALDRMIFIPSGDPPHKSNESLAPAHHRLAMVKQAVAESPHYAVSDVESTVPGPSYTVDTIRTLRRTVAGELWFIIGLDAFLEIGSWKSGETLVSSTNFLVVSRPPARFSQAAELTLLPPLPVYQLHELDAGRLDRLDVPVEAHAMVTFLRIAPCPVSASAIRERIHEGLDVTDWLPRGVQSYIIRHHLYGGA